MSYVDAAINRLKDDAERKAATTPPPDAGDVSERRKRNSVLIEFSFDDAQTLEATDAVCEAMASEIVMLRCERATLTAQLAAANADGERLDKALRIAAGVVSTLPGWSDKHPQEAYDWIVAQSQTDAARTGAR